MGTVRFRGRHDDAHTGSGDNAAGVLDCVAAGCEPYCARPEADLVFDTYAELGQHFGLSKP